MNYTSLGNGTAAGSNWTLTGLSLPTGQNLYIRARGYYLAGVIGLRAQSALGGFEFKKVVIPR